MVPQTQVRAAEAMTLPLSYDVFPKGTWARVEAEVGGRPVVMFLSRNGIGLNLYCPQWGAPEGRPFYSVVAHGGHALVASGGQEVTFTVVEGVPEPQWFRARVGRIHLAPAQAEGMIPLELLAFDPDARERPETSRGAGSGVVRKIVQHAAGVASHAASYPVGRVKAG